MSHLGAVTFEPLFKCHLNYLRFPGLYDGIHVTTLTLTQRRTKTSKNATKRPSSVFSPGQLSKCFSLICSQNFNCDVKHKYRKPCFLTNAMSQRQHAKICQSCSNLLAKSFITTVGSFYSPRFRKIATILEEVWGGKKKPIKHEQLCGIVPGTGGCQIRLCVSFLLGRKGHVNKLPEISGK